VDQSEEIEIEIDCTHTYGCIYVSVYVCTDPRRGIDSSSHIIMIWCTWM